MMAYFSRMPRRKTLTLNSLSEEEKREVVIQGFSHGSVSEKAGMQKGDAILALDEVRVHNVEDVRIELLFKKKGDRVKVKISRKEPGGGDREIELEVLAQ